MQYHIKILLFVLVITVSAKKKDRRNGAEIFTNDEETVYDLGKLSDSKQLAVESFIETLLTSEKYLKKIEAVERKVHHLDTTFVNRTNTMLKYLSEIMKSRYTSTRELTDSLNSLRADWESVKGFIKKQLDVETRTKDIDVACFCDGNIKYGFDVLTDNQKGCAIYFTNRSNFAVILY